MSWVLDLSILLSIFVCVYIDYICSADYVGLPVLLYLLLQCLVLYHMLSKMRSSGIYIRSIRYEVIGEVLVLGLLVVVYKIPYSSNCCM